MNTVKWFDRKFDFSIGPDSEVTVYERLKIVPGRLREIVGPIREDVLVHKPQGKWSVKEHVGHLSLLEALWRVRFEDIQRSKPVLTPADLENNATSEAGFNNNSISALIDTFAQERNATLLLLDNMNEQDKTRTSLHPRLHQPMRIIDLAFFVAEHDDHHLGSIKEIISLFEGSKMAF